MSRYNNPGCRHRSWIENLRERYLHRSIHSSGVQDQESHQINQPQLGEGTPKRRKYCRTHNNSALLTRATSFDKDTV